MSVIDLFGLILPLGLDHMKSSVNRFIKSEDAMREQTYYMRCFLLLMKSEYETACTLSNAYIAVFQGIKYIHVLFALREQPSRWSWPSQKLTPGADTEILSKVLNYIDASRDSPSGKKS
jgi:hypothetical protein